MCLWRSPAWKSAWMMCGLCSMHRIEARGAARCSEADWRCCSGTYPERPRLVLMRYAHFIPGVSAEAGGIIARARQSGGRRHADNFARACGQNERFRDWWRASSGWRQSAAAIRGAHERTSTSRVLPTIRVPTLVLPCTGDVASCRAGRYLARPSTAQVRRADGQRSLIWSGRGSDRRRDRGFLTGGHGASAAVRRRGVLATRADAR